MGSVVRPLAWAAVWLLAASCAVVAPPSPIPRTDVPQAEQKAFGEAREALSRGDRARADSLLRDFLKRYPRSLLAPNAALFLGQIAYEGGNHTEALRLFSPYLGPGTPNLIRVRAHQWSGAIRQAQGQLEAADLHYRTALRLADADADRAASLRPLVRIALDRKRPADAVEHLAPLLPLIRDAGESRTLQQQTVDLIFLDLGLPDVERLAGKITSGFPSGYLAVRRAELLREAGRTEAARRTLEEFLARAKGHPLSGRAARLLESLGRPAAAAPGQPAGETGVPVISPETGAAPPKAATGGWIVGVLLPLSGTAAEIGQEGLRGVQLALQHAGRLAERVKLKVVDSMGAQSPADQVRNLVRADGVAAILGPLEEPRTSEAARAAQAMGVPLVLPTAPSVRPAAGPPSIFLTGITNAHQAEAIAAYAIQRLDLKTFAILYPSDAAGLENREVFRRQVTALGGRVVREASYSPNATDFSRQVQALGGMDDREVEKLRKAAAEKGGEGAKIPDIPFRALFIPDRSAQVALIVPSLSFHNIRGITLLGGAGWNSPELIALAKRDVEGSYFIGGYGQARPTALRARFARDFQRAFSKAPSETAAFAYDAMRFLLEGLRTGGADRDTVRRALAAVRDFDGVAGRFSIGPSGAARRDLPILTVSRGKIVPAEGSPPLN